MSNQISRRNLLTAGLGAIAALPVFGFARKVGTAKVGPIYRGVPGVQYAIVKFNGRDVTGFCVYADDITGRIALITWPGYKRLGAKKGQPSKFDDLGIDRRDAVGVHERFPYPIAEGAIPTDAAGAIKSQWFEGDVQITFDRKRPAVKPVEIQSEYDPNDPTKRVAIFKGFVKAKKL